MCICSGSAGIRDSANGGRFGGRAERPLRRGRRGFRDAERTLQLATGTFLVPLDPARALVAKDTRANHDKYERQAVETVYPARDGGGEMTEIANMAKNVFALQHGGTDAGPSALTFRGPAPIWMR